MPRHVKPIPSSLTFDDLETKGIRVKRLPVTTPDTNTHRMNQDKQLLTQWQKNLVEKLISSSLQSVSLMYMNETKKTLDEINKDHVAAVMESLDEFTMWEAARDEL